MKENEKKFVSNGYFIKHNIVELNIKFFRETMVLINYTPTVKIKTIHPKNLIKIKQKYEQFKIN